MIGRTNHRWSRQTLTRFALLSVLALAGPPAWAADTFDGPRQQMVEDIKTMTAAVSAEIGKKELSPRVLDAMATVPRHEFVPPEQKEAAYRNRPLDIGHRQTISQPFIVALMTDLLDVEAGDRVLEVGTGSGYQAAVLAELVRDVYTIEIVRPLAERAAQTFAQLGAENIYSTVGDGYRGWPDHAPYDAIMVTAAPDHVPKPLIEQLKPGGRLVMPVGGLYQELMVMTKNADGTTTDTTVIPVRFVPLTRAEKN